MSKRSWMMSGAALAVGGFALHVTAASATDCREIELFFVERPLNDHIVDVGYPEQDSLGDLMVWSNKVYNRDNSAEVGTDSGWCTRTAVGRAWECTFTLSLSDIRITAAGTAMDGEDPIFAVVGGTGRFFGVTGELNWLSRDQGGLNRLEYRLHSCS